MKRILCYGDSLTYGFVPSSAGEWERYDENTRWTGILQKKLGSGFVVIEEGLPARTIDLDDPRPDKEWRNGSVYLQPCLESHIPLDAIVLFLGTNDTKDFYERSPHQIAESMKRMIETIESVLKDRSPHAKIVLISPPPIDTGNKICALNYSHAQPKLEGLATGYEKLAQVKDLEFINLFSELEVPQTADGIHLDEEANRKIAELVHEKLIQILE